jgi:hypothetical protein
VRRVAPALGVHATTPSLDDASKGIIAQAKAKPVLFAAYAVAAVVVEAFAVIEALKADR